MLKKSRSLKSGLWLFLAARAFTVTRITAITVSGIRCSTTGTGNTYASFASAIYTFKNRVVDLSTLAH